MKPISEIAQQLSTQYNQDREKKAAEHSAALRHKESLEKSDDLKVAHIVQMKLLSDHISKELGSILSHLESQKPEITKEDLAANIQQVTAGLEKLAEVLPKELQTIAERLLPQENYWTEERLAKVLQENQPEFPKIVIPEPKEEVRVTDLEKAISLLEKIAKKPDFKETKIEFPDFPTMPSTISVDNLSEVVEKLTALVEKEEPKEELPLGITFHRDAEDNLAKIVEIYPSGTVTSEGWNLGRVKVTDDR